MTTPGAKAVLGYAEVVYEEEDDYKYRRLCYLAGIVAAGYLCTPRPEDRNYLQEAFRWFLNLEEGMTTSEQRAVSSLLSQL